MNLPVKLWKWLGKNCSLHHVHKVKRYRHTYSPNHMNHLITISPPTLLRGDTVKFNLRPSDPNSIGYPLSSWTTNMKFESGQKPSLYCAHKVLGFIDSDKFDLDLWPKINQVPPLIVNNLPVKFKSDWAKTVVCIISTRYNIMDTPTLAHLTTHGCITISSPMLLQGYNDHKWLLVITKQIIQL